MPQRKTMIPKLAKTPIQARFATRCEALLHTMVEQARQEDTWDIYLAKGAGDRAIAGDHEERHLLELLQNARDAIYRGRLEGNDTLGRVLILVAEHGVAMANTGAPFRLDQEEVLKAVRFLMRSDKAGYGFIGHKGKGRGLPFSSYLPLFSLFSPVLNRLHNQQRVSVVERSAVVAAPLVL